MQRTQIGRSAFYAYFKDIHDLAETFVYEIARGVEASGADWLNYEGDTIERVRSGLRNGAEFWRINGRMIRALTQASSRDKRLRRLWHTEVAMRPVTLVAEAILRDQAAGLIGPMDADEMSRALNRFNLMYLNDCFGSNRRSDVAKVVETLERVWLGTLYGALTLPKRSNETAKPRRTAKFAKTVGAQRVDGG
jgi:AcrR family transcriptional regulator